MKPSIFLQSGAALVPTILASLFVPATSTAEAQTASRVPAPLPPSLDVKTPAELSVQTFPSERAARSHAPAAHPGDRASIPPDAVNRDPAAWLPNDPGAAVRMNEKRQLDPRLPADRVRAIDHSIVHFTTQDETLWARGENFKVSFDAHGASYIPVLGRLQPHNVPHALSPDLVTVGGEALDFERAATATRDGDRVVMNRGAFTEAYDLTPESLEQTFVFSTLPGAGDLVVHIPIASEFDARETGDGLEFRGEHGRVARPRSMRSAIARAR